MQTIRKNSNRISATYCYCLLNCETEIASGINHLSGNEVTQFFFPQDNVVKGVPMTTRELLLYRQNLYRCDVIHMVVLQRTTPAEITVELDSHLENRLGTDCHCQGTDWHCRDS